MTYPSWGLLSLMGRTGCLPREIRTQPGQHGSGGGAQARVGQELGQSRLLGGRVLTVVPPWTAGPTPSGSWEVMCNDLDGSERQGRVSAPNCSGNAACAWWRVEGGGWKVEEGIMAGTSTLERVAQAELEPPGAVTHSQEGPGM